MYTVLCILCTDLVKLSIQMIQRIEFHRNALFERQTSLSAISETANIVDAVSSRREVKPEYVTIRRQRPTTEETTTQQ